MKENMGYDFFNQASKMILFLPVVILILLMTMWSGSGNKQPAFSGTGEPVALPTAVPTSAAASFNLTGPLACGGQLQEGTASALIKDRHIIATLSASQGETHVLVAGDCAYLWAGTRGKTGTKMCGIGGALSMADSLLSMGLMSPDSLLSSAGFSGSLPKNLDVQSLMRSCKKAAISMSVFAVPKGIDFVEKSK